MTTQHLINRIAYLERFLKSQPDPSIYMGDSDAASDAVDQENRHNDELAEKIQQEIYEMKLELLSRGYSAC